MPFELPKPTVELVKAEGDVFDHEYQLAEQALRLLWDQFPKNTDIRHVLLKVLVLNKLYGTMIPDIEVETVAKHIVRLHIDARMNDGDLNAVADITACPDLKKAYLSFASKFCSWHNPTAYPIYDSRVRECLWCYQKLDSFAEIKSKDDLYYYQRLFDAVVAFRKRYELNSLTFKQLDKFMYRMGSRILQDRADQKKNAPT